VETRDAGRRRGPRRHSRDPSARRSRKIHRPTDRPTDPRHVSSLGNNPRALQHPASSTTPRPEGRYSPFHPRSFVRSFVHSPSEAAVTSLLFFVISLLTLLLLRCISASSAPQIYHLCSLPRLFIAFFISFRMCLVSDVRLPASSSFIRRDGSQRQFFTLDTFYKMLDQTFERELVAKLARRRASASRVKR